MAGAAAYSALFELGSALVMHPDSNPNVPTVLSTALTAPNQNVAGGGAGTGGIRVDALDIVGLGPTTATTMRVYTVAGGVPTLKGEIAMPASTPNSANGVVASSSYQSSQTVSGLNFLPIFLPANTSLAFSMQDAQFAHKASYNSVALVQSPAGAGNLTLAGALATVAASAAAISALQTTAGAALFTQTAYPFTQSTPTQVTVTSTGNISAVNFTLTGTDASGADISEVIAGPNNSTVFSTKTYLSISSVMVNAAVGTNTSVGTSSAAVFATPSKIIAASPANNSGISVTLTGTSNTGATQSEVIAAGPNAGTVTSVNSYKTISGIKVSGAGTNIVVGNTSTLSGFAITPLGGQL